MTAEADTDTLYLDEVVQTWWDQDPSKVPHETGGLLRMYRAGFTGTKMVQMFEIHPVALAQRLQKDVDLEHTAHHMGRPIHDARIKRGKRL